jgi:uncharacterized protein DUF4349
LSQPDSILIGELRGARLSASSELKARVREIAARQPASRRLRLPELRLRPAVLVPAALAAAFGAAAVAGIVSSFSSSSKTATAPVTIVHGGAVQVAPQTVLKSATDGTAARSELQPAPVVPASKGRAQDYQAEMRLRVADLSKTTKRALWLTHNFGGYVRSIDYGSGAQQGTADLVVRIPIGSVQAAIVRFSALGTIVDQHVAVRDVQPGLDARFKQIQAAQAQIADLLAKLADQHLSSADRALLQARLVQKRGQLAGLRQQQAQVEKRVSFATVSLSVSTHKAKAAVVPPSKPGKIQRALDHAGSIVVKELVVLVYIVVLGVPLLLLALLALSGERRRRRRATDRLLATG